MDMPENKTNIWVIMNATLNSPYRDEVKNYARLPWYYVTQIATDRRLNVQKKNKATHTQE
jgi:hypothetical protein